MASLRLRSVLFMEPLYHLGLPLVKQGHSFIGMVRKLTMCLPVTPVPLLPDAPDSALDLQLALDTAYDTFGYDLTLDYTRPPEIPLVETDAAWVVQHLRSAGFITAGA